MTQQLDQIKQTIACSPIVVTHSQVTAGFVQEGFRYTLTMIALSFHHSHSSFHSQAIVDTHLCQDRANHRSSIVGNPRCLRTSSHLNLLRIIHYCLLPSSLLNRLTNNNLCHFLEMKIAIKQSQVIR